MYSCDKASAIPGQEASHDAWIGLRCSPAFSAEPQFDPQDRKVFASNWDVGGSWRNMLLEAQPPRKTTAVKAAGRDSFFNDMLCRSFFLVSKKFIVDISIGVFRCVTQRLGPP